MGIFCRATDLPEYELGMFGYWWYDKCDAVVTLLFRCCEEIYTPTS